MENVNWGVPTKRSKKVEKYNTPVLTMLELKGEGTARKFEFNKAAQKALRIDSEKEQSVMTGFANDDIFVKVVDGLEHDVPSYKLTKTGTFSNKKVYEFITEYKELENNVDNEFDLVEENGIFKAILKTSESQENKEEASEENISAEEDQDVQLGGAKPAEEVEEKAVENSSEKGETKAEVEEDETW